MEATYVVEGWNTASVRVRRNGPGMYSNPLYIHLCGNGEVPSPPVNTSRAEVYRWLADLEEKGFVTEFARNS